MQCLGYNHRIYIESSNIYRIIEYISKYFKTAEIMERGKLEGQEKMVSPHCRSICPGNTINGNDMLSYSLTAMMCFLTKE